MEKLGSGPQAALSAGTAYGLFDAVKARGLWFAVLAVLLAVLYYPIVVPLVGELYNDPNYSHGLLVPFISGYFLYTRIDEMKSIPVSPSNWGLVVILAGVCLMIVGFLGAEHFTVRVSMIVVLAGMVLYFLGTRVFRVAAFPIAFLFFAVPLPYIVYDMAAFPLKLMVSKYSVMFLKGVGIMVWREGNIITFPNIELEVADACSGIRSLMSLIALGTAFAYITQRSKLKMAIVIFSAIPVAIFANAVRVIMTGILARHWGAQAAEGFFHEFAGLAVFALAIAIVVAIGTILRRVGK